MDLRREAVRSLEKLGDRRALKPLMTVLMNRDEDIFLRRLAGGSIVKIDRELAFGPLAQIVKDDKDNAPARRMAAEKLTFYRDDRAFQLFAEVLRDKQQPWWLRKIAANRLGSASISGSSGPICIEALKAASDDVDKRIAEIAQHALGKISTTHAESQ